MCSKVWPSIALALSLGLIATAADARPQRRPATMPRQFFSNKVAFMGYLRDARVVTVYADGRAKIASPPTAAPATPRERVAALLKAMHGSRPAPARQVQLSPTRYGSLEGDVAPEIRRQILFDLDRPQDRSVPGRVVVVFKPGVTIAQDRVSLPAATALAMRRAILSKRQDVTPHPFTSDARTNRTLMQLGVDGTERLFAGIDRGTLGAMRSRGEGRLHRPLMAFDNTFVMNVGGSSVANAVRTLREMPSVAYAAPDYAVTPMIADRRPMPAEALREMSSFRRSTKTFGRSVRSTAPSSIPGNTAVSFNLQAMLGATGVDAVAAFDEIGQRFGQLPGTGEIITNVGYGDADDASAASNPKDPCHDWVQGAGPTTRMIGGQRYLDWPSLPLIPVWVSDRAGNLSPTGEVCGVDPFLGEVGLDFSVMAPLPDNAQRAGATASFATDLLGIAPGASYRWVAVGATNGVVGAAETLGAFIGAARQQPAPSVITASLGFGADGYGFPGRYFEDDPLAQSVIAAIVSSNIVVCVAANDGTRGFTAAAVGPSGGSAPTNAGTADATTIDDVYLTTIPSVVPDSGAIAVGATTLDDIFSANPQDHVFGAMTNVPAFAETRYNGMLGFSSGFGSRVNLSAPGDNIQALYKAGTAYNAVSTEIAGGTSASAPEVAAAAAVAMQVAKLTGHPYTTATQVRDTLVATGTPVATPPQSDVPLNVGPQVSVRRIVEQLLANAGKPAQPGIARVAVHGRRTGSFIAGSNTRYVNDGVYVTALDPSYIKLDGPFTRPLQSPSIPFPGSDTGADLNSYITIAPDWEGIPANATYRLSVAGQPGRVIGTTPYVRLLPAQLFAAAGVPLSPGVSRTLSLTYSASVGLHAIAASTFQLTFGPPAANSRLVLAPKVPPVVTGSTIPVTYDLRGYPTTFLNTPTLNVSVPGVGNMYFSGYGIFPAYSVPLTATNGTIDVPVAALAGAGTYTIWIAMQPITGGVSSDISDLAFTRVDAGTARPAAPLLSLTRGGPTSHTITVPYKGSFAVSYDVSRVAQASGAIIELSAPPPKLYFAQAGFSGYNTFRNPNGNAIDDDGFMTGSIYHVQATGTTGAVTIDPALAKIPATNSVNVRVIATAGGRPVAEASDAGTVTYEGINTGLGFPVYDLFLNPHGTDGYLLEAALLGNAQLNAPVFALEPFDVNTGTLAGVALSFANNNSIVHPFVQNDTVIAMTSNDFMRFDALRGSPPSAGFSSFSFAPGTIPATAVITAVALQSSMTRSAYLAVDTATGAVLVTRGDVMTGSGFAPSVDITSALGPNLDYGALFAISYDPGADRAYLLVEDASTPCDQQSPALVTIDFSTGIASMRALGIGGGLQGRGYSLALDPGTHMAAIATSCQSDGPANGRGVYRAELSMLDLNTGTTNRVFQHVQDENVKHGWPFLIGGDSPTITMDEVNHLVLQRSIFCPALLGGVDLNARACLNEYDQTGRLVKTTPGLFGDGITNAAYPFDTVNGALRLGVANGEPVSIYDLSFDVQPFTY